MQINSQANLGAQFKSICLISWNSSPICDSLQQISRNCVTQRLHLIIMLKLLRILWLTWSNIMLTCLRTLRLNGSKTMLKIEKFLEPPDQNNDAIARNVMTHLVRNAKVFNNFCDSPDKRCSTLLNSLALHLNKMLECSRVSVTPDRTCWSFKDFLTHLIKALEFRAFSCEAPDQHAQRLGIRSCGDRQHRNPKKKKKKKKKWKLQR